MTLLTLIVQLCVVFALPFCGNAAPPNNTRNTSRNTELLVTKDDVTIRRIDSSGAVGYPHSLWPLPPNLSVEVHPTSTGRQMKVFSPADGTQRRLKPVVKRKPARPKERKIVCMNYRLFALTVLTCDYPENLPKPSPILF